MVAEFVKGIVPVSFSVLATDSGSGLDSRPQLVASGAGGEGERGPGAPESWQMGCSLPGRAGSYEKNRGAGMRVPSGLWPRGGLFHPVLQRSTLGDLCRSHS